LVGSIVTVGIEVNVSVEMVVGLGAIVDEGIEVGVAIGVAEQEDSITAIPILITVTLLRRVMIFSLG